MRRPVAPALDGPRVARWTAAMVPWWVPRLLLVAGWFAAVVVAAAGDVIACTALDPSVCGPDVGFAWAAVALFVTPVLLWWLPLGGCAAGMLFAVLDLMFDQVPAARVAFGVHGLLCLVVAVWLLAARRRQMAVVAEVAGAAHLDAALAERLRGGLPGWGERTLAAVVLGVIGIAGVGWYAHRAGEVAQHMSVAVRMNAVVVSIDNDDSVIVVAVTPRVASTRVGVLEAATYHPGQVVPVIVDQTGAKPWVRLVAEPDDVTGWLTAGLAAFALAGVLLVREQRMRSARRRLLGRPMPAVELTTEPDEHGRALLQAGSGADRKLIGGLPVVASPADVTSGGTFEYDEGWTLAQSDDFGQDWRSAPPTGRADGDGPQAVTVLGDLRDGGWLLLITDNGVLLPEAPLRTPQRLPWRATPRSAEPKQLPGHPVLAAHSDDPPTLPQLPVVLRSRRRDRAIGVLALLGVPAGPAVVLAGWPDGWWETVVVLWAGGAVCYGGWRRLNAQVGLTRGALVVYDRMRVHQVPWQRLHGVRRDKSRLWLAWDPDVIVQVGPFASTRASGVRGDAAVAEHWGAVMMRLRDLSLAAGDPGGSVTRRAGSSAAVVVIYTVAAVTSAWWQHR